MNIKNYIVTVITMIIITFIGYQLSLASVEWDVSSFLFISGLLNTLAFIMFLAYNPRYENAGRAKKVMSGNRLVENDNMDPVDYVTPTGNSFVDNLGFGINYPNIVGLVYGVILIILGSIL